MTSRERTCRAITFDAPDRVPLALGPDADIAYVGYGKAHEFVPAKLGMSEWGCVWKSLHPEAGDQGQVIEHPLSDFDNIHHYRFPDPFAPGRMDGVQTKVEQLHSNSRFVCASLGKGPMHLLDDLRGFEAYLIDLMTEPDRIELLLVGIFDFLIGLTEQFGHLGADAVIFYDDQAAQKGPLFSMDRR